MQSKHFVRTPRARQGWLTAFFFALLALTGTAFGQEISEGPFGGSGGDPFDFIIPNGARVTKVEGRAGDDLDALRLTYKTASGTVKQSPWFGGTGGSSFFVRVPSGDYWTKLRVCTGKVVDRATFTLSNGYSRTYGKGGSCQPEMSESGFHIVGIFGRSGRRIDRLGVYLRPIPKSPTARFTANKRSGLSPLKVSFTDSSTGSVTGWAWSFGDGGTSSSRHPTHTYKKPGTYDVTLTVSGWAGSDTETKKGHVVVNHDPPRASFTASSTSGHAPHTVMFTDSSTGPINSWLWDFGDGSTSSKASPSHVFPPGTFVVKLKVIGPGGSDTATTTVSVDGPFTFEDVPSGCTTFALTANDVLLSNGDHDLQLTAIGALAGDSIWFLAGVPLSPLPLPASFCDLVVTPLSVYPRMSTGFIDTLNILIPAGFSQTFVVQAVRLGGGRLDASLGLRSISN